MSTAWCYYTGKGNHNQPTLFGNRGGLSHPWLWVEREEVSPPQKNGEKGCFANNFRLWAKKKERTYEKIYTYYLGF